MAWKTIFVFDTNVILNDPYAIFAFDDAEIIIPQTVLAELDKLKTGRADREVRFRGREFSRILFDLSEYGTLTDGILLDNNSRVRVFPYNPNTETPSSLNNRNADDRILGCAWQLTQSNPDTTVVLLTNDLNMLLKAQTLGIKVKQYEYRRTGGRLANLFARLRGRRVTLAWLVVPLLLISLSLTLWFFNVPSPLPTVNTIPTPAGDPLQRFAAQELTLIKQLKEKPGNISKWMELGKLQLDWAKSYQDAGRGGDAGVKYQDAVNSFRHVIKADPKNLDARNYLGTIFYLTGNSNQAINEFIQIISIDPGYANAHYNLGVVLWRHQDLKNAKREFENYLKIAPNGERAAQARRNINEIKASLAAKNST